MPPQNRHIFLCFGRVDTQMFPVFVGMLVSRATSFCEAGISKVFLRLSPASNCQALSGEPFVVELLVPRFSVSVGDPGEIAISRITLGRSLRTLHGMPVVNVHGEMLIDRITKTERKLEGILRPYRGGSG